MSADAPSPSLAHAPAASAASGPSAAAAPQRGLAVVTGAGGFIGSHLVETLLARGWSVRALVHYNALGSRGHLDAIARGLSAAAPALAAKLEIVAGDVTDARCVRALVDGAAAVFHLAALIGIPYSYIAPQSYVQTNIVGTMNVLEACRDAHTGILLHTSTSETLGTARVTPQDERHLLQGQSPYAATKIAADKLAESYFLSFGLPVVTVRPFNTYGPRQSARAVIPTILSQALSPECPEIRLGSLTPVRDLTFVADTARAFAEIAESPRKVVAGRLYHLGCGAGVTVGEIARLALDVAGVEKPIVSTADRIRPERSEVLALVSDPARIAREVGWHATISLREGLAKTAEWIRHNPQGYRPTEYAR